MTEIGARQVDVCAVRGAVNFLINAEGDVTQAVIARETGLNSGRLSQFLGDKYPGDNLAIAVELAKWLEARDRRLKAAKTLPVAPEWVPTPTGNRILPVLDYARMAGDIAVIYGGAGVGKTKTIKRYAATTPNVWHAEMAAYTASLAACLRHVAEAMEIKSIPTTPDGIASAICKKLKDSGGLLVVDEAQHLSIPALEGLRGIHDHSPGVGLVFAGNELVYTRLSGGTRAATFAQIFSRIGKKLRLRQPQQGDVTPIIAAFGVTGKDEHDYLYQISQRPGALRGMVKTLRLAAMLAAGDGVTVNIEHIRAAWSDLDGAE